MFISFFFTFKQKNILFAFLSLCLKYLFSLNMFQNRNNDIDFYIYHYKSSILNKSFDDYSKNKMTYDEYYNVYNKRYIDLIKLHNVLIAKAC